MALFRSRAKKSNRSVSQEQSIISENGANRGRLMLALEPRYLFDGAAAATMVDVPVDPVTPDSTAVPNPLIIPDPVPPAESSSAETPQSTPTETANDPQSSPPAADSGPQPEPASVEPGQETSGTNESGEPQDDNAAPVTAADTESDDQSSSIVIIDGGVEDSQTIKDNLDNQATVYVLDSEQDGVEQITTILQNHDDVESLHIMSHGSSGSVTLGNSELDAGNIEDYRDQLQQWGASLTTEGDILLYGCHVGNEQSGTDFISELSEITGADVAASTDSTGSAPGENWVLEKSSGTIEAASFSSDATSLSTAETEVTIDDSGNLVITDVNDTGTWDNITLSTDGSSVFIYDPNNIMTTSIVGATGAGSNLVSVSLGNSSFTGNIIVNTKGGDDRLIVDFSTGDFSRDIIYDGGDNDTADGDVLELKAVSADDFTSISENAHDGSFNLDGTIISYQNLEPIHIDFGYNTDQHMSLQFNLAGDKVFDLYQDTNDPTVTVISCTGFSETFLLYNTSNIASLTLLTGDSDDIINIHSLGEGFGTLLNINGEGGDDTLNVDFSSGTILTDITFNGGSQSGSGSGDSMNLAGGSFFETTYNFDNANDGSVVLDGQTINYTGLEPITASITATDVTLNYSGVTETITVTDGGSGTTTVDSTAGEVVTFLNPTNSLTINAGDGDDSIVVQTLSSTFGASILLNGQQGSDDIRVWGGITADLTIDGGEGDDTVNNSGHISWIYGGDGNDIINNRPVASVAYDIQGGSGRDTIRNDFVVYGTIQGNGGADTITNIVQVDNGIQGNSGDDTIINRGWVTGSILGGGGNDSIENTRSVSQNIEGGVGNDTITITDRGSVGIDVTGDDGLDTIVNHGQIGHDILGGAGRDTITNRLTGTIGNDIGGGGGMDHITNRGTVDDDIQGNGGADTIVNSGTVAGNIEGNGGEDEISNAGQVYDILGGTGNDTITNRTAGYVTNDIEGGGGDDTIINRGTVDDDIQGNGGADTITNRGGVGDDIEGNGGDDTIFNAGVVIEDIEGGSGNDTITNSATGMSLTIRGGADNDTIINRGLVAAIISGGAGDDTITNSATGDAFAILGNSGADNITNRGYVEEALDGGGGNDTIFNSATGDIGMVFGGGGDDTITNRGYAYYGLDGGAGDDTITNHGELDSTDFGEIFGGSGNDTIVNTLTGTLGYIIGNSGNDTITNRGSVAHNVNGRQGNDTITNHGQVGGHLRGGEGNDIIDNVESGTVTRNIQGGDGNDRIMNRGSVDGNVSGGADRDMMFNLGTISGNMTGRGGTDLMLNLGTVGNNMAGGAGFDLIGNAGTVGNDIRGNGGTDLIGNIGSVAGAINGGSGRDVIANLNLSTLLGRPLPPLPIPLPVTLNTDGVAGSIQGGGGSDIVIFTQGSITGSNPVDVDGGNGRDLLAAIYNNVTISGDGSGIVSSGTGAYPGGSDTWDNFEGVIILGTLGDDIITIDSSATVNAVFTLWGDDQITYHQGSVLNIMNGGPGNDTLTGYYTDDVTINGTPANGWATYPGLASPDNWLNFEEFTLGVVEEPAAPSNPEPDATTPLTLATPEAEEEFNWAHLYHPDGPGLGSPGGYVGLYAAGPGSLVQSMLNSITGPIDGNLGSSGGLAGTGGEVADAQPYTEPDPEEVGKPVDEESLEFEQGADGSVESQDGPGSEFNRSESDDESKKKQVEEEENDPETTPDSSDTSHYQFPDFLEESNVLGLSDEIEIAAFQFEHQRQSLLAAVQGMAPLN